MMARARSAVAPALALVAALTMGCARGSGERTAANIQTFKSEQSPDKLYERGRAFAAVGDLTRAEEYFGAALEQGADPRKVMPLLLMVCIQDSRFRLAAQYAEDYLHRHPNDPRTRLVLGTIYAGLGDNHDAEREFRRVIRERPSEAQAHYALGVLLRDTKGDTVGADEQFREYLKLDPTGPYAEEARTGLLQSVP